MHIPLSKYFYVIVFLGTFSFFMLHSFTSVKLPVIKITFEPNEDRNVKQFSFRTPISNDISNRKRPLTQSEQEKRKVLEERKAKLSNTFIVSTKSTKFHENDYTDKKEPPKKEKTTNDILIFLESFKQNLMTENEEDKGAKKTTFNSKGGEINGQRSSLSQLLKQQQVFLMKKNVSSNDPCPDDYKRAGLLVVNRGMVSMSELEDSFPNVYKGGHWFPSQCKANKKIAVVVPFRDRQTHLNIFLRHMHQLLQWHLLSYRIFVIEQGGKNAFNRGMLMNIGYAEAKKTGAYDCVIFHDVDLIPEDGRNDYSCPSSPRHMSTAVDTMKYRLQYKRLFGGVEGFWTEHYEKINGFPNRYWGWGAEDDDLYVRITVKNLHLTRPAIKIGRYTMLRHTHSRTDSNPNRYHELRQSEYMVNKDGLNNLRYKVTSRAELSLYTLIVVDISPNMT